MKKAETIFKEKVLSDLKRLSNAWFTKVQQVCIHGTPDIIGVVCGFFIAIELKAKEKDRPDNMQAYTLDKIRLCGCGLVFVAYPENWKEIYIFLTWLSSSGLARAMAAYILEESQNRVGQTYGRKHIETEHNNTVLLSGNSNCAPDKAMHKAQKNTK